MAKILVCVSHGVDEEKADRLFERVAKLQGFDALFCIGNLFSATSPYVYGEKEVPLDTFIIGDIPERVEGKVIAEKLHFLGNSGISQTVGNLRIGWFLEKAQELDAVGTKRPREEDKFEVFKNYSAQNGSLDIVFTDYWPLSLLRDLEESQLPADLKATTEEAVAKEVIGTESVAQLNLVAKPRYHFSGALRDATKTDLAPETNIYYERPPFIHVQTPRQHFCRFIALPEISTPKQKWLYAMNIVPIAQMTDEQLAAMPDNLTTNPFLSADDPENILPPPPKIAKVSSTLPPSTTPTTTPFTQLHHNNQALKQAGIPPPPNSNNNNAPYFGQQQQVLPQANTLTVDPAYSHFGHLSSAPNSSSSGGAAGAGFSVGGGGTAGNPGSAGYLSGLAGSDRVRNKTSLYLQKKSQETPRTIEKCWFCIDSEVEEHLIVSMGDESYLALPKGGLTPDHVLIVPLDHIVYPPPPTSTTAFEIHRYKLALVECFAQQYKNVIFYERNVRTQYGVVHYYVQCIPIPVDFTPEMIEQKFVEYAKAKYRISFIVIPNPQKPLGAYVKNPHAEYFLAELPGGKRLLHVVLMNRRHPLQLGREVIAELLDKPERKNWKECILSQPEEQAQANRFRELFAKHDFNNV